MGESLGQIKTSDFRKFLEFHGLKHIRTKGDHEIWSRQDLLRPIVVVTGKKEMAEFHVRQNLRTLNLTVEDLRSFLQAQ